MHTAGPHGLCSRPIALVYAFLLAFSNVGFWIVGLGLFTLLAGVFTALVVLRDRDVSVGEWDRKFLLCTAVAVTIVLSALGLAAILATYLQPSTYDVSEQGLFYSWTIDFDALGYPAGRVLRTIPSRGYLALTDDPRLHGHCHRWQVDCLHLSAERRGFVNVRLCRCGGVRRDFLTTTEDKTLAG